MGTWEPYAEKERDAGWRQGRPRATPLLARPTPPLLHSAQRAESGAEDGWYRPDAEWSGALPVPKGQRQPGDVIGRRIATIEQVPYELLGWADRWFLLYWARKGYPVYAYRAPAGRWNLWLDSWRVELPLPEHLRLPPLGEMPSDDL